MAHLHDSKLTVRINLANMCVRRLDPCLIHSKPSVKALLSCFTRGEGVGKLVIRGPVVFHALVVLVLIF